MTTTVETDEDTAELIKKTGLSTTWVDMTNDEDPPESRAAEAQRIA